MQKKNENDLLRFLTIFKNNLDQQPTQEQMYEEVRMMHFKIKPIQGDISVINLNDNQLIELLWKLGKLDEIFHSQYSKLNRKEKAIFFNLFDSMHQKLQQQLGKLNLKAEKNTSNMPIFEMEIIKELPPKKVN